MTNDEKNLRLACSGESVFWLIRHEALPKWLQRPLHRRRRCRFNGRCWKHAAGKRYPRSATLSAVHASFHPTACLSISSRTRPGSLLKSQRMANGTMTMSSISPRTGMKSGIKSMGDSRYSATPATPHLSHEGDRGCFKARSIKRASLRTKVQMTTTRFHIDQTPFKELTRPHLAIWLQLNVRAFFAMTRG